MSTTPEILVFHAPKGIELKMHICRPAQPNGAAMIGVHGGSWIKGNPESWYALAEYFTREGMTVFLPQYRLINTHNVDILDLIDDTRAAIRWVYQHAAEYALDPQRIGLAGGSAGGHLVLNTYFRPTSPALPRPAFFLLGNPVIDSTETGYGDIYCGEYAKEVSPLHQLQPGIPPTLILHGSADTTTPVEGVREYERLAKANGDTCELIEYAGKTHGFFNMPENHPAVCGEMIRFLKQEGMITPEQ